VKVENAAPLEIRVAAGRAKTHPTREKPQLSLDRRALASILYGAVLPSEARAISLCEMHGDADAIDRLFALPPFFAHDPF
jgi:hypothetical protein